MHEGIEHTHVWYFENAREIKTKKELNLEKYKPTNKR
jgi:hypothetical protein